MKRTRLSLLLVLGMLATLLPVGAAPAAAATSELFFSEYIEGSSLNKALEIYNGTGGAVDLDAGDYEIRVYFNGSSSPGTTIDLGGSVADGDVYVVADDGADPAILAVTDQTTASSLFNGDDAVVLFKGGTVIDAFGQVGVDPGSQWPGGGQNDTLTRFDSVCAGDTNSGDPFNAAGEWNVLAQDTFAELGTHTANCDGAGPTILINEVDADTPGSDAAEFVELYDGGAGNTALDGLVVVFYNGSDDQSYNDAFDLDGLSTDADGYLVLGNAGVDSVDVVFPGNGLQNGADAVALVAGDAIDYPNDTPVSTTGVLDAIVYDTNDGDDAGLLVLLNAAQPQVNEGGNGDKDNHSNQRCPNGSGGARNTDTYDQYLPTPGAENTCEDPVVITDLFIHEIQGSGSSVTAPGTFVRVRGVVVGDYQGGSELDGFFLQEEDFDVDGDAETSEGIFVYCEPCSVEVLEGNIVEVVGVQEEFFDMSQIDVGAAGADGLVSVIDGGDNIGLVTAATVDLPAPASTTAEATFENVEGMLVTFADELTATEYFQLGRFGQIVLSEDGRLRQFTNDNVPSATGFAEHLAEVSKRRIILDDINNFQNLDPVYHPQPGGFAVDNFIRGGDTITDLTGVMHWSWAGSGGTDAWRIRPQVDTPVVFNRANPRDLSPEDVGGDVKVATLNVLNYFTTIDEGDNECGPIPGEDCRGAHSEAERLRQLDKLVAALSGIDADVVGLVEIENNPFESLESITTALNSATGDSYDYVDAGYVGNDVIKVGFIYNTDTVTASGDYAILDTADFVDPNDTGEDRNRAALAETFTENVTGESFTAVVNHFKSKGSPCGAGDDDTTTGQGNCAVTRDLAAAELADWLAGDPTGSGDADVIVIGDLNAYAMEDAITTLKNGADDTADTGDDYTDLVDLFIGKSNAYSFVFSGEWGYLDHALASESLTARVTGVTHWHINADEVNLLDYNDEIVDENEAFFEAKPDENELYAADAFRSSDHDPVIVGLNLANPRGDKETVSADLAALLPTGDRNTDKRLNKAIESIDASLNLDWWVIGSDQTITNKKVFDQERQAVAQLDLIVDGGGGQAGAALDAILTLLNADRQLAQIELIAAIGRGGNASKIADSQQAMADAAAYIDAGLYVDAVNAYKAAWDAATKA